MTETTDRLQLLFDWASAQKSGQRLAIWLLFAIVLHGAAFLLFRVTYPPAEPVRISDAGLFVLLPGSPEERRLAPFLNAADPALFAPEQVHGLKMPDPPMPAYEPSYAATKPQLLTLPDREARVLPPLIRDFGPVTVSEAPTDGVKSPAPAAQTQVVFSNALAVRAPQKWPEDRFTARPGDQLGSARFLIAVAPDGRVLHVIKDGRKDVLDDAASQYLMKLWFRRGGDAKISWGTATFHWGLDVKREELH